ncbi:hypothetical protein ACETRX_08545 [Labrys portucalensis]|uniref:Uncharacterized protein n=1 Tax=Labrys neptuniae TaxID=376174 RepID=A0ABV6ZBS2_9HYPH
MNKLILASMIVMGGFYAGTGTGQAASRPQGERYADNARLECVLPWYRFFGACDEAIQDPPDGKNGHAWEYRSHRHRGWRR